MQPLVAARKKPTLAQRDTGGKLPDSARESIIISGGVEIGILESLRHDSAHLGVIAHSSDLLGIDVDILVAIEIDLDIDVGRKVELAVEGAGAVAGLNGGRGGKLVHPRGAGGGAVEAGLDAVALGADLREGQVHLGHDAGDVKAADVCGARGG